MRPNYPIFKAKPREDGHDWCAATDWPRHRGHLPHQSEDQSRNADPVEQLGCHSGDHRCQLHRNETCWRKSTQAQMVCIACGRVNMKVILAAVRTRPGTRSSSVWLTMRRRKQFKDNRSFRSDSTLRAVTPRRDPVVRFLPRSFANQPPLARPDICRCRRRNRANKFSGD